MQQIVECVPNFSEGRNPAVINAIVKAMAAVSNANVINVGSDADHNRTVVTIVGSPEGVEEAAFQGIATAKELINLDEHEGQHPRIGATDVCPFIPVRGVTSADCKAIAYRLGERVGRELEIAVYYYGLAAKDASRKALPDIRQGEYEGWKAEIGHHPARKPDEGPEKPAPWGATVIGVRQFMAAYNVYLNTNRVEIADAIAEGIRHSSGGFRYIQAKGFLVEGQAQVSMNFHNLEQSPIHRVQEAIRREAARFGCLITHSELVGLIPQKALHDAAKWYLQLDGMRDDQVLEYHLQSLPPSEGSLSEFVEATASSSPTPGGGSIAALAGALGAALAQMVSNLTLGRHKYKSAHNEATVIREQAKLLQAQLMAAISEDAAAFEGLMAVMKNKLLPAAAHAEKLEAATMHAALIPLQTARLSRDVARLCLQMVKIGNPLAVTDAASAAFMAEAGVRSAALNVRINAVNVKNRPLAESWLTELESLEGETSALAHETAAVAAQRGGFA